MISNHSASFTGDSKVQPRCVKVVVYVFWSTSILAPVGVIPLCHKEWAISGLQKLWQSATKTILKPITCPHRYHMTWFLHRISLWGEIPNLLVFTPKRTLYFLFQVIFKSVALSSDYGEPSIEQNEAPPLMPWTLSIHSSNNCDPDFSCFFPMSIPFLQYLHPTTFFLTELKSPFEEWLAHSGYSILILEHVISYFLFQILFYSCWRSR